MANKSNSGTFGKGRKPRGRPRGALNKTTVEIREFARAFLADDDAVETYRQQYREGRLNPSIHQLLMYYAYGKPRETVAIEGQVPPFVLKVETPE